MSIYTGIICVALGFAVLATSPAHADRVFKYPRVRQEKDNWCWAGCSQWILGFHGTVLSQTDICKYGFTDGAIRDQWNWIYCSSANGMRIVSDGPGPIDTCYGRGINQIVGHFGVPWAIRERSNARYTLSEEEFRREIDNGHPFVVRYNYDNGNGHFVVAMGYRNGLCWLMNPWKDDGIQIFDYDWVADNKDGPLTHHEWDYTLQTTKTDTVPELTTEFPASIAPGTKVSLVLTSELNGRDVTDCTFFTPLTEGVEVDSATRTVSWTQTEKGPETVTIIREFGNAIDTIVKSLFSTATSVRPGSDHHGSHVSVVRITDRYTVSLMLTESGKTSATLRLLSANGKTVYTERLSGPGKHTITLRKQHFTPGVYLLSIAGIPLAETIKMVF
ncbi:MAG: C39 family peptidase [Chitinispirillaceae bacterium]|nr:C39 family peptidase [Chitinispirillaceae bacterium]